MSSREKFYPRGKITADDEGGIAIRMAVKANTLIIDFGKPVAWIGLGLQDVRSLRTMLDRYIRELEVTES
jgi:hypothetical protein